MVTFAAVSWIDRLSPYRFSIPRLACIYICIYFSAVLRLSPRNSTHTSANTDLWLPLLWCSRRMHYLCRCHCYVIKSGCSVQMINHRCVTLSVVITMQCSAAVLTYANFFLKKVMNP